MKPIAVDPIAAFKASLAAIVGAAIADTLAPWVLVTFTAAFAAWLSSAFAETPTRMAAARIIAKHAFAALVATLPALAVLAHMMPSMDAVLPWLLMPIAAWIGFRGPETLVGWWERWAARRIDGVTNGGQQ